jgi:hypothetical protein
MHFCPDCGKPIQHGCICSCKQYPQNQQLPPQYPQQYPQQQQKPKIPGQTMVRVTGIVLTSVASLAFIDMGTSSGSYYHQAHNDYQNFSFLLTLTLIVIGIIGISFASMREKGSLVVICGVIMSVLFVIDFAWSTSLSHGWDNATAFMALAVTAFPVLYIIGGNKMKSG